MLSGSIDIRHLESFLAVAQHRSFGKAAEAVGYTQSAVSQQIAVLERATGTPVFERPGGPRPVTITEAGRILERHARTIIDRLHQADQELSDFRDGTRGHLALGSFQSTSVQVLPAVVRALHAEFPHLELDLYESDDARDLVERLERRELDVSFMDDDSYEHHFDEIILFQDPYVAVVPRDHPTDGAIQLSDLAGTAMIGQKPTDACQRRVDAGLTARGITADYVFRSGDNAAVQAMVRAKHGIAILPRLATDPNDPDISIRELEPPLAPRRVGLIWRDDPSTPPAVHRFVELVRDLFADHEF